MNARTPDDDATDQFVAELLGPPLANAASRIEELLREAAELEAETDTETDEETSTP